MEWNMQWQFNGFVPLCLSWSGLGVISLLDKRFSWISLARSPTSPTQVEERKNEDAGGFGWKLSATTYWWAPLSTIGTVQYNTPNDDEPLSGLTTTAALLYGVCMILEVAFGFIERNRQLVAACHFIKVMLLCMRYMPFLSS